MNLSYGLSERAFVLAAGRGLRLRPLTEDRPKPLIPVAHRPLISYVFDRLVELGIQEFVVNTHHVPEAFQRVFPEAKYQGRPIHWEHEPLLLDTGGGIRNVSHWFGRKSFLISNGDIFTDLPIGLAVKRHLETDHLATLVLRSHGPALHVAFDPTTQTIVDIRHTLGRSGTKDFLYTGIAVISPEFVSWIPPKGPVSLVDVLLEVIRAGRPVGGIVLDQGVWFDLGTREAYLAVHRQLRNLPGWMGAVEPVHPTAHVHPSALILGDSFVGPGAKVGEGSVLIDSIIWEKGEVAPGSRLVHCIVRDGRLAKGELVNADV
ncbi:sugar phosphate nucleotidyltransferase [Candidatus Methylacidithermus pantelleriae]|uniref:Mannose-1-phosphate guanylyltransferase n=1 Tax=Candidatus Methylacidithermus pantelleriae TaxID=2744239 RepID=A0A8J2FTC4_9BACT|nr:sugar phosphate nucleotidyltransferase [Candidatus Methylacidithermus pantelleriae]CAF0703843.1 Mannose-1-phosphate guanylyltransferase [Candidatus Methylacidithermus pantelleriae]